MNKYLILAAAWLAPFTVYAATFEAHARVSHVEPVYYTVKEPVTTTQEICRIEQVPVYDEQQREASTADVAAGAIFGGLIGNSVGGGSGKDAATIIGAIVGADIAKKSKTEKRIVGYRNVEVCEMVETNNRYKTRQELSHTIVTASYNGVEFTYSVYGKTAEDIGVGDRVPVTVTVTVTPR